MTSYNGNPEIDIVSENIKKHVIDSSKSRFWIEISSEALLQTSKKKII